MTTFSGVSDPVSVGGVGIGSIPHVSGRPRTLLPLTRFAQIVQYSPMLFNQVQVAGLQDHGACSSPMLQYTWQQAAGGRAGRDEVAFAIAQAEEFIEQQLKFPPGPKWFAEDIVSLPQYGRHNRLGVNAINVRASHYHVVQGGFEDWTLIQASSPITYSDTNADGYAETATVTTATTVTNPAEIAVYYPGSDHDYAWEVRPVDVSITGGVATIRFARYQVVLPDLLEKLDANVVDGMDNANFLGAVDVYRRFNNPSKMAVVEWPQGYCESVGCTLHTHDACFTVRSAEAGVLALQPGTWDTVNSQWNKQCPCWYDYPTRARLWYRAGLLEMPLKLEQAISFLALSFLDRDFACEPMHNLQNYWKQDMALREGSPSSSTSFQLSRQLLDNPFGTTRAAVFAWRIVQPLIVGEAVLGN